jgi:hypothetical protein
MAKGNIYFHSINFNISCTVQRVRLDYIFNIILSNNDLDCKKTYYKDHQTMIATVLNYANELSCQIVEIYIENSLGKKELPQFKKTSRSNR